MFFFLSSDCVILTYDSYATMFVETMAEHTLGDTDQCGQCKIKVGEHREGIYYVSTGKVLEFQIKISF